MSNEQWQAYSLDTDPNDARALFEKRYGYPPVEVREAGPIRLAGPLDERTETRQLRLLEVTQ